MSKAKKIVEFIKANNPRRKELVKFIQVNLNKRYTLKEWNALPTTKKYNYYGNHINRWKTNGNIEVDAKTKRYSITKYYNGKLYKMSDKVHIEMLEARSKHWKALAKNTTEYSELLERQNKRLKEKLKKIENILS